MHLLAHRDDLSISLYIGSRGVGKSAETDGTPVRAMPWRHLYHRMLSQLEPWFCSKVLTRCFL
jgi:hypothetical protein